MKCKYFLMKYWAVILVFALCIGVTGLFCYRKTGMFIDEIYSYGLSNSYYDPYLTDVKGGSLTDQEFFREEINDYLTVGNGERFSFGSVYYNQTRDVHPPLYYLLLNCVSSFFPETFSKWIGVGLNAGLFFLCLILIFFVSELLFENSNIAAGTVALYGLSVFSLSMVMMIRMYTLLTVFTLLLAFVVIKIIRDPGNIALYPLLTLVICCGVLTQYYFIFYAFFLCLTFLIYILCKKQYRELIRFILCALAGIVLMIVIFPASIRQLFVGNGQVVGGSSILETLKDVSAYQARIDAFKKSGIRLKNIKTAGFITVALLVCMVPGLIRIILQKRIYWDSLLVILPAVPAYLVVAIISPVSELRYVYNLTPFYALAVSFLLHLIFLSGKNIAEKYLRPVNSDKVISILEKIVICLFTVLSVYYAKKMPPDNLFTEHTVINELCDAHASSPCVYISKGDKFAALTQDLLQLKRFDSFFVTDRTESKKMLDYIGDSNELILFIDTNKFWSSGYDPNQVTEEIMKITGMNRCRELYSFSYEGVDGLSSTYILSK